MRSVEEIIAKITEVEGDALDFMGTRRSDLICALPYADAKPYLQPDTTEEEWRSETDETIIAAAREYLAFAIEKATGHRGLSAGRAHDHYWAWVWLTRDDTAVTAYENSGYSQYGMPAFRFAAAALGFSDEWYRLTDDNQAARNMADGIFCEENCQEGCGS